MENVTMNTRTLLSILLCMSFIATAHTLTAAAPVQEDQHNDQEESKEDLQKRIEAKEQELQSAKQEKQSVWNYVKYLAHEGRRATKAVYDLVKEAAQNIRQKVAIAAKQLAALYLKLRLWDNLKELVQQIIGQADPLLNDAHQDRSSWRTDPQYTQTEAHLQIPHHIETLDKKYPYWKKKKYQKLLERILAQEKKFNKTHYAVYHGSSKPWIVPQDLYGQLFTELRPLSQRPNSFRFLRFSKQEMNNVGSFLEQQFHNNGIPRDTLDETKRHILAVNLALFGGATAGSGEFTFSYFTKPKSHAAVGAWAFEMILKEFGVTNSMMPQFQSYIDRLMQLDATYLSPEIAAGKKPKEQLLLQILIPKDKIDEIGYASWARGIPYDKEIIKWIERQAKKTKERRMRILDVIEDEMGHADNPLAKRYLDFVKEGKFRLSDFLDTYMNTPEAIPYMDKVQARIVFTDDVLLNPSSGIQFFEYSFIPKEQKKAYEKELKEIANDICNKLLQLNFSQASEQHKVVPSSNQTQTNKPNEPTIEHPAVSTEQSTIKQEVDPVIVQKRLLGQKIIQDVQSLPKRFPTLASNIKAVINNFTNRYAEQLEEIRDLKAQYDELLQQNSVTSEFVDCYADRLDKLIVILDTLKQKLLNALNIPEQ